MKVTRIISAILAVVLFSTASLTAQTNKELLNDYVKNRNLKSANQLYNSLSESLGYDYYTFTSKDKNEFVLAQLYSMMAEYCTQEDQYGESVEYALLGSQYATLAGDEAILTDCYSSLCVSFLRLGIYDEALKYAFYNYEIDQKDNDPAYISSDLNNLASVYYMKGDLPEAEKYIMEAIEVERPRNSSRTLAVRLGKASEIYIGLNRPEEALAFSTEAYQLDSAAGRVERAMIRKCQMADCKKALEQYDEAEKIYLECVDSFRVENNVNSLSIACLAIGDIAKKQGKYKKAEDWLKEAGKQAASINNNIMITRVNNALAETLALQNENEAHQRRKALFFLVVLIFIAILAGVSVFFSHRLNKANKELDRMNHLKDKLFSVMSHDLRSPLAAQKLGLQMLAENFDMLSPDQQKEICSELEKQTGTLYDFVENLLSWARLQVDREGKPLKVRFNMLTAINEATGLYAQGLQQKELTLKVECPSSIEINSDRNMFLTMIRNLVTNSIKFTPRGGTISITAREFDKTVSITLSDTGIGMPDEIASKLFTFDKTLQRSGTESEKGSGLGLVVVKEMANRCGGSISVTSKVGVGSSFTIVLPIND